MSTAKRFIILCSLICFWIPKGWSQADYLWLRSADELYTKGAYTDAETGYRKALEEKEKPTTAYNLGNTIYNQNRIPEAIQQYQKSIESTQDPSLKSHAYYNLGNAHFQNKEYKESIQAYKESLKLQPKDEDAKKNLMLAMRQYQQQQQQQENKDDPSQENEDQQQQSSSEKSEDKEQDQPSQDQNQAQPNEDQQPAEDLSQEEAREILKAIEREDQRVQEKLKKAAGKTAPPIKDW